MSFIDIANQSSLATSQAVNQAASNGGRPLTDDEVDHVALLQQQALDRQEEAMNPEEPQTGDILDQTIDIVQDAVDAVIDAVVAPEQPTSPPELPELTIDSIITEAGHAVTPFVESYSTPEAERQRQIAKLRKSKNAFLYGVGTGVAVRLLFKGTTVVVQTAAPVAESAASAGIKAAPLLL